MAELVKCPICGQMIESDSYYCDQCGELLKICPDGHGFKKGKICGACGKTLVEAKSKDLKQTQSIDTASAKPVAQEAKPVFQEAKPAAQTVNSATQDSKPKAMEVPLTDKTQAVQTKQPRHMVNRLFNLSLDLKEGAIIGRKMGEYVVYFANQPYVSGTHAQLQKLSNGDWQIMDLNSTNGTFVNGKRLNPHQPETIRIGDEIAFYDYKFIVE